MAILPIYTYDARVLREKTREVPRPDAEISQLILDMFETMRLARGIGLAANQVGKEHSIFVIDVREALDDDEEEKTPAGSDAPSAPPAVSSPLVFINPVIKEYYGDDVSFEEGCLSVPNVREEIFRPEKLHIRYRDVNFVEQELDADGILARVIQHEFDHLEGVFFTDYLRGLKKRLVQPALKKIKRGEMEADYRLARVREMDVLE